MGQHSKKLQIQSAKVLRNKTTIEVRRNKPAPAKAGEGRSAIPQYEGLMDFLLSRQTFFLKRSTALVPPKPKELVMAAFTSAFRAWLGT
jgi:hypothetical protein